MKKLRFTSIICVLLLFSPFLKQCDGFTKTPEKNVSTKNSFEIKEYFTEESESIFDLTIQGKELLNKKVITDFDYKIGSIAYLFSILFSTILLLTSFVATIRIFRNRLTKTKWLYILNIVFIILIVISNLFLWLDRFGQIKIGFYLLLLTNFYMFYQLKQTSQKQDLIEN